MQEATVSAATPAPAPSRRRAVRVCSVGNPGVGDAQTTAVIARSRVLALFTRDTRSVSPIDQDLTVAVAP